MSSNLTPTSVDRIMPQTPLLGGEAMSDQAVNLLGLSAWCTDVQGAYIADRGHAATKFSPRLGPPSCSPPV